MGIALVTAAVLIACAWLALSMYLAVMEASAAVLHADYVKCQRCGRHYFEPHAGRAAHTCASRSARARYVLSLPAHRLRRFHHTA